MKFGNYLHSIQVQVRFSDVDRLDHVNNACYHSYFELGRVKYFNDVFRSSINWNEKGFVLAHAEIDYMEPLHLSDEVYCFTRVSKIGTKSITVHNSIVKNTDNSLVECASGLGVLVAMDYSKNISLEVPSEWVMLIKKFEGSGITT